MVRVYERTSRGRKTAAQAPPSRPPTRCRLHIARSAAQLAHDTYQLPHSPHSIIGPGRLSLQTQYLDLRYFVGAGAAPLLGLSLPFLDGSAVAVASAVISAAGCSGTGVVAALARALAAAKSFSVSSLSIARLDFCLILLDVRVATGALDGPASAVVIVGALVVSL